jgi:hypothetical protein
LIIAVTAYDCLEALEENRKMFLAHTAAFIVFVFSEVLLVGPCLPLRLSRTSHDGRQHPLSTANEWHP